MQLPRRSFIREGLLSAVSLGLVLAEARTGFGQKGRGQITLTPNNHLGIPLEAQRDAPFLFTQATFDPYVGGIFLAPNARGEIVELKLLSVKAHTSSAKLTKRTRETDSFSLIFEASSRMPLFTSIHHISHSALGEFDLFMSPRNGENGELFYEAVINHVR